MVNGHNNLDGNTSTNDIQLLQLVSPQVAIRGAVGDLGMGHLLQSLEDDMLRWVGEANEKIIADTRAETIYEPDDQVAYTKNNRIKLCCGFQALECVKLNGRQIDFLYSPNRCSKNCSNSNTNCNSHHKFYLQNNYMFFSPKIEDGQKVEVMAWKIPQDEDGYILIIGKCVTAIQKYVSWKICHRQGDRRAGDFENWWYHDVRQARAWINKKTDAELRAIGKMWFPPGFFLGRHSYSSAWVDGYR